MTPPLRYQASPSLGSTGDVILGEKEGEKDKVHGIILKQAYYLNTSVGLRTSRTDVSRDLFNLSVLG